MRQSQRPGRIVTFYSYKGGTGRSMLVANSAWLLASAGYHVLAVDWDLEAPGLHRYLAPFLTDPKLTDSNGLIDMVIAYASEAVEPSAATEHRPPDWYRDRADVLEYAVSINWNFTSGGTLSLLPSGRQGDAYASKVNSFSWQNFYDRLGGYAFFEALKDDMRRNFDFVLIDSRTGVSDTAGICTVQFPDALVACFTLNNQSIEGVTAVTRSVLRQKTPGEFEIFPVPTRIDNSESDKLRERWQLAKERFSDLPHSVPADRQHEYWDAVAVPYVPKFAYEEILASFGNRPDDPVNLNILANATRIAQTVFSVQVTHETLSDAVRSNVLDHYAGRAVALTPAEARRLAEEAQKKADAEKAKAIEQVRFQEQQAAATAIEATLRKKRLQWASVSALVIVLAAAVIGVLYWNDRRQSQLAQQAASAGDEAAAQENWAKALESYNAAIEQQPDNGGLYSKRASVLMQQLRWQEAIKDWDRAIALLPFDPKLVLLKAEALLQANRNTEAIHVLTKLSAENPSDTTTLEFLADAYHAAGLPELALKAYTKLIEMGNSQPETLLKRASLYSQLGNRDLAVKDLQRVMKENPESTSAVFAEAQLNTLGVRPTPALKPPRVTPSVIYIHYSDGADAPIAEGLRGVLQAQALKTPKIQLQRGPNKGEIRYFQPADLETAARVKRIVEDELAKRRYLVSLELRILDAKEYNSPSGVVEVWLPPLQEAIKDTIKDIRRRLLR